MLHCRWLCWAAPGLLRTPMSSPPGTRLGSPAPVSFFEALMKSELLQHLSVFSCSLISSLHSQSCQILQFSCESEICSLGLTDPSHPAHIAFPKPCWSLVTAGVDLKHSGPQQPLKPSAVSKQNSFLIAHFSSILIFGNSGHSIQYPAADRFSCSSCSQAAGPWESDVKVAGSRKLPS